MRVRKTCSVSWMLFGLVGAFLTLSCIRSQDEYSMENSSLQNAGTQLTGFPDYDWLPEELKRQMDYLVEMNPDRRYRFYYFFKTNDINKHFYMTDRGLKVIQEMPVTNAEVLNRIEKKLSEIGIRKLGLFEAHDHANYQKYRLVEEAAPIPEHKFLIFYVLPAGSVDFRQLRVAIVEDTLHQYLKKYAASHDFNMYELEQVDVPPHPVRGLEYFQDAVLQEAQLAEVFALFDTGAVTVEFAVEGLEAQALDVIQGLDDWNDSYEAYQADSEFMKAVHHAKVRWKPGRKDGKPVRTKMKITFRIDSAKVSSFIH